MSLCHYTFEVPATVWVAGLAAIISFLQLKIANTKIKLDLYDKRFRVYQSIMEYSEVSYSDEEIDAIRKKMKNALRESEFLFKKSDLLPDLIRSIRDAKSKTLKFAEYSKAPGWNMYVNAEFSNRQEVNDLDKQTLTLLVKQFEKIISGYIEFRSVSGFDLTRGKKNWL